MSESASGVGMFSKAAQSIMQKLAEGEPVSRLHKTRADVLNDLGPGIGAVLGTGLAAATGGNELVGMGAGFGAGALATYGISKLPHLGRFLDNGVKEHNTGSFMHKFREGAMHEAGPVAGSALGAGLASYYGINPVAGAAAGYGLGSIPNIVHTLRKHAGAMPKQRALSALPAMRALLVKQSFATSEYSGNMNPAPLSYRNSAGMPGGVMGMALPVKQQKTASATTGAGRLAHDQAVGAPRQTAPGPSIAALSKPPGMGRPISGAMKGTL